MSGARIEYGGVAVGAKENFTAATTDKAEFVDLSELKKDGTRFLNYGNPCELYSVALDGKTNAFPENTEEADLGLWSQQISDAQGKFATDIVLTLTSSQYYYSSSGITFVFDTYNNIYSNHIIIEWYQDNNMIMTETFYPDSAFYFCSKKVENYNKIIVTFKSINMPYNRLKLRSIEYGMQIVFYGDELKNAKIIQKIDPLSAQIMINTCDFTIDSKKNIEYSFEERQPITVYFNDILRLTAFVETAKRKSKNIWTIQAEDYIGLMENVVFYGGIYVNKNATDLLIEIFEKAKVPYEIAEEFDNEVVSGYIPYTNCREALMQVCFAIGAVVDTSNSNVVKVFIINQTVNQNIPLERIMQGQNFTEYAKITAVEVSAHEYVPISETVVVYDSNESGEGNNIFVKFSEPLHSLNITGGTIVKSETNYAIINANANCELVGSKYEHREIIKSKQNPIISETDVDNIISVQNATLVSITNLDKVIERCYNYYSSQNLINLKIVEGKHEVNENNETTVTYDQATKIGEVITCDTEYLGNLKGYIVKQSYNLNGGIIIKDTVIHKTE